jgi:hypothetical protein
VGGNHRGSGLWTVVGGYGSLARRAGTFPGGAEPTAARVLFLAGHLVDQRKRADCGTGSPIIAALGGQYANRQSEHERGGGNDYASGRHGKPPRLLAPCYMRSSLFNRCL